MKRPKIGSQAYRILCALERGERLSLMDIEKGLGGHWIRAASKRVSELREYLAHQGITLEEEWVKSPNARYKVYYIKQGQMEMFAA